jgi:hypothetical protein
MIVKKWKTLFYLALLLIFSIKSFSQTTWKSKKYGYQTEIPKGFKIAEATGVNVDFKAVHNGASIIIVVKKFPQDVENLSIWQALGDLDDFADYFQNGLQETANTPKVIKYGKTFINNYDSFWIDYTTDSGKYYYKNYMIKKGQYTYTITFFADKNSWNYYSAFWFRFKEQIKF